MEYVVNVTRVLDQIHLLVREHDGEQWLFHASMYVPDPDAPTDADTLSYALYELAEGLCRDAREGRGFTARSS